MNSSIIQVDKLTKRYLSSEGTALKSVSFEIIQGEIFSLLGPNGAGKTTIISILTGLLRASSGDARLCGYSISTQSMLVKKNIGVVPQEIALYPMITVRQNLIFFARIYGLRGSRLNDNINRVLKQVNLIDHQNEKVCHLSGGMQRRLNIAVALVHDPKVLFMDEPTVGIDLQNRVYILDTIKNLNRNGMSIFYTSHYMEEVQEISDRIGVIDHGKIIALGTHEELLNQVKQLHTISFNIESYKEFRQLPFHFDKLPEVSSIVQDGKRLQLKTNKPNEIILAILNTLNKIGINLTNLTIESPNLETVFLTLTGNKLRD